MQEKTRCSRTRAVAIESRSFVGEEGQERVTLARPVQRWELREEVTRISMRADSNLVSHTLPLHFCGA